MNNDLLSTSDISLISAYVDNPKEFFMGFKPYWQSAKCQILKLETKQTYIEKGNPSYELLVQKKFQEAVELIPTVRTSDLELYESLVKRKINFVRCRPVVFPLSIYMRWELEVYKFNAEHCENIYCVELDDAKDIFATLALHDFMVFDDVKAFIHNYDDAGQIQGGWIINDSKHIQNLIMLYSLIKAKSRDYSFFLQN